MFPKYHYSLEQGTQEWLDARKGKMTASHAQEIGNQGKGLETYVNQLMAEFYSNGEKVQFTSEHIERGHEMEDQARSKYCFDNGVEVTNVGFIEHNNMVGCSPDGLVGKDGMIEIKCPADNGYFQYLLNGEKEIDTKYMWQMQMNLMITGRKWCDFIAYNQNYEKSMFIHRVFPDQTAFIKLEQGFLIGRVKIDGIIAKYNNIMKK